MNPDIAIIYRRYRMMMVVANSYKKKIYTMGIYTECYYLHTNTLTHTHT